MTPNKPDPTNGEEKMRDIAREAHIKWLEKAETARINGSEMTVLPYGYLQTAVKEALLASHLAFLEQMIGEINAKDTSGHCTCKLNFKNECVTDLRIKIDELKKII